MRYALLLALVSAIGFGGWPLFARASGANQLWINGMLMCVSFFVALPLAHLSGFDVGAGTITTRGFLLLLAAGTVNGFALIAFGRMLTDPLEISTWVPITNVLITIVGAAGGILLFKESVTPEKIIGLCLALAGVWLLNR